MQVSNQKPVSDLPKPGHQPIVPFDIACHPNWAFILRRARQTARSLLKNKRPGRSSTVPVEVRINGRMRVLSLTFQHVGFRSLQSGIPTPRLVSVTG